MAIARTLSYAIETRRGEIERVQGAGAQFFKVTGEVTVYGVGEAIAEVTFPVLFTEEPRGSYFGILFPGSPVEAGSLPTLSVVASHWGEQARDDGTALIQGATLAIVTTGPEGQNMRVQWHMEGTGLRSPIDG